MNGKLELGWRSGLYGLGLFLGIGVAGCSVTDKREVVAPPVQQPAAAVETTPEAKSASGTLTSTADDFRAKLIASRRQIDSTLGALAEVANPNTADLRAAYDRYCDQLSRTEHQAVDLKKEAGEMRTARQAYFASWEAKASEIDNPTIRASAEARRQRVRDANERIIADSEDLRDAYDPLMRDLQDVRIFLSNDLSKQNASMLGDVTKKSQADGAVVKQKIDAIVAELDKIESGQ